MVAENDPRPVLRQELARVFKNQRVIRAFEKIFDLIPPEFIDQQQQIDDVNLTAEFAATEAIDSAASVQRLSDFLEQLLITPVTAELQAKVAELTSELQDLKQGPIL